MKKTVALLLCLCTLLCACQEKPEQTNEISPLHDYTEAQSAALAFGQEGLTVSFRGSRVIDGVAVTCYSVRKDGDELGVVACDPDGNWYADTDRDGLFTTLHRRGESAVFGEEIIFGEVARSYLVWEGQGMDSIDQENFTAVFDHVYESMHAMYGNGEKQRITVSVAPCEGGAEYADGKIRIDPAYLSDHTNDYDILTELLFYPISGLSPDGEYGYMARGLAMFCRTRYGVYLKYNSYGISYDIQKPLQESVEHTAVFLDWVSGQFDWDFTAYLCDSLQNGSFATGEVWVDRLGFDFDGLWKLYQAMKNVPETSAPDDWRDDRV